MLSETSQKRMREAIGKIHKSGIYPSVEKVSLELGRMHSSMNSDEREFRLQLLNEFGISNRLMRKKVEDI